MSVAVVDGVGDKYNKQATATIAETPLQTANSTKKSANLVGSGGGRLFVAA